jgi:hypothetical protein
MIRARRLKKLQKIWGGLNLIKRDTEDFVIKLNQNVEGWLYDDCVFVTAAIQHTMAKIGVSGPNFEIGVFKGKYLSAMHHCARTYNNPQTKSFGWDIFTYCEEQEHRESFKRMFGTDGHFEIPRC